MAIKQILEKLFNKRSGPYGERPTKLSPEEVELMSYKERERKDRIKMELAKYRLKNNKEMLVGNTFSDMSKQVQGNPKIINGKDIFNEGNIFKKARLKHKGGNIMW